MSYAPSPVVAARLVRTQGLLINGDWCVAADGAESDVYDPSSGVVISAAARATTEDTERAVAAARKSFDEGVWTGLTPAARGRILWRAADLLEEYADEIAELKSVLVKL